MALPLDRSKYRNPDMPVGYDKKQPELVYKEGVEIDGVHYIYAPYIYEAHIEEREDYATLSEVIFSSDEEEDVPTKKKNSNKKGKSSSEHTDKLKREKHDVTVKDASESFGGARKKTFKHAKKSNYEKEYDDAIDSPGLEDSLSRMDIDPEKHKKRKHKKIKKEHKSEYRSDSCSPPSVYWCESPPKQRGPPSVYWCESPPKQRSPLSVYWCESPPKKHRSKDRSPSPGPSKASGTSSGYKYRSPSPGPSRPGNQWKNVKVKMETFEEPEHLFGSYHCKVCNITTNSLLTFKIHESGKRHRKNMMLKNIPEAVIQSIPATAVQEDQTRYPKPAPGVIRKRVNKIAKIQHIIEDMITVPCPGLNFVFEIQGISGTQYYCSMCDCVCSSSSIISHLTGFKHQLRSVKQFKPGAYEDIQAAPKYAVEKEITSILRAVKKKGRPW